MPTPTTPRANATTFNTFSFSSTPEEAITNLDTPPFVDPEEIPMPPTPRLRPVDRNLIRQNRNNREGISIAQALYGGEQAIEDAMEESRRNMSIFSLNPSCRPINYLTRNPHDDHKGNGSGRPFRGNVMACC